MLLPFIAEDRLVETWRADPEMAELADRHYSRQSIGSKQFMPTGRTLILRNNSGTVLFAWSWQKERYDQQEGYNCTIFRNESERLSSEIILEAEQIVQAKWGPRRIFTYVNPGKVKSSNPGYCFKCAGWKLIGRSRQRGRLLLTKEMR